MIGGLHQLMKRAQTARQLISHSQSLTTMVKRPRVDTSAASSHLNARVRVDEPEVEFDLFDDGDLAELKRSIFDGQLSDLTLSDAESVLLSLSDVENEDLDITPSAIPSGDWTGIRMIIVCPTIPKVQNQINPLLCQRP